MLDVPPGAVTLISTIPAEPAGTVAVIWVALFTVKLVAATVPKVTADALVKPVPVIVTEVPPPVAPLEGEMLVIVDAAK